MRRWGKEAVNGIEAKSPTSRRPIKKAVRNPSQLSESTNRSASPPSGKRETDENGRISSEDVSLKTAMKMSQKVINGGDQKTNENMKA